MLYAIVVVLVLIADQLVKYWVTANITLNSGSVELIPGILKLVNIHNDGAAFSLFPGYRWIFVGLAAAVTIAVILALIFHWIKSGFGRWMAVLTMAGALGNAIDRAIYGYVVDMFVIEPVKFIQVFNVQGTIHPLCINDSTLAAYEQAEGVSHAERFTTSQGILKTDNDFLGVMLKGIGPEYDTHFINDCIVNTVLELFRMV